jgi:hypothetical protein
MGFARNQIKNPPPIGFDSRRLAEEGGGIKLEKSNGNLLEFRIIDLRGFGIRR